MMRNHEIARIIHRIKLEDGCDTISFILGNMVAHLSKENVKYNYLAWHLNERNVYSNY